MTNNLLIREMQKYFPACEAESFIVEEMLYGPAFC